mmetsp:Transcript_14328/g.21008  ORF Transcript_14328/g.21008 Transcript_14328/m.21008 type:complete len:119 (-) Transcript_14328:133-489(-)
MGRLLLTEAVEKADGVNVTFVLTLLVGKAVGLEGSPVVGFWLTGVILGADEILDESKPKQPGLVSCSSKQEHFGLSNFVYSHTPLPEQFAAQAKLGQTAKSRGHSNVAVDAKPGYSCI